MTNEKLTFEEEVIERFEEEITWLFDGTIIFTGPFGEPQNLNVELTVSDLKMFITDTLRQHKLHLLKEIEGKKPERIQEVAITSQSLQWKIGFNYCLDKFETILNNFKQ